MLLRIENITLKSVLLTLALSVSSSEICAEDDVKTEPATDERGTICVETDKQIYSSKSTNIDDFMATNPSMERISKKSLKDEKDATLYVFTPGNIFCVVKDPS